jgi:hypothetical protein
MDCLIVLFVISSDLELAWPSVLVCHLLLQKLVARREAGGYTSQLMQELDMLAITQVPIVVAAAQYSLIYLLLGGGFGGAIVIYIVAKVLGK